MAPFAITALSHFRKIFIQSLLKNLPCWTTFNFQRGCLHLEALAASEIMEENGEDVASLAYISTDGSYTEAYISTDGSYTETVPMPNDSTLTAPLQDSSSATKSKRQPVWTEEETRAFIQVWGDDAVQSALASNYRTVAQFQWIADEMRARGYNRDWEQCRERAKALRRGFKEIVDGNSNVGHGRHGRRVWPYFEELNQFLCIKQNLVVPRLSGSVPGAKPQS